MSKKLGSKLADSVRHAKQQTETATETKSSPASSKPAAKPDQSTGKYAAQTDQAPKPSLDNPWDNLYPARIWPD